METARVSGDGAPWRGGYSGLKNRCNVWQFWSGCDVVLDRVRIMLSVGGVK